MLENHWPSGGHIFVEVFHQEPVVFGFGVPVKPFAPYHGEQPYRKLENSWPWAYCGSHCSVWLDCGSSRRSVV